MDTVLCLGTAGTLDILARGGTVRRLGPGDSLIVHRGSRPPSRREYLVHHAEDGRLPSLDDLGPIDVVLVDERPGRERPCPPWESTRSKAVLPPLLAAGVHPGRILILLPAGGGAAQVAYKLGRMRIGSVLVEPFRAADVRAHLDALLGGRPSGKAALCLGGGGIEGLIFELGALRALDAFLPERGIADVDLFCGMSAGAVIGAFLANGIPPDEIARGFRHGTQAIGRVGRGMLFRPDVGEIGRRLTSVWEALSTPRGLRFLASILFRAVPVAIFSGDPIRQYLERELTREGRTNSFRQLRHPLYVGATDQDSGEHVVFGETGWDDVPISQAVRASTALPPFYGPERIKGRYFVDGAFTRTVNLNVAIQHGATFVIVVDPLVPVHAPVPGYVRARGGAYAGLQGLKSLIDSRFGRNLAQIRELNPDVDIHVIRPDGDQARILSGSPMKYFYREQIHEMAYEATVSRLRDGKSTLGHDFVRHGFAFRDPSRLAGHGIAAEEALARGRAAGAF